MSDIEEAHRGTACRLHWFGAGWLDNGEISLTLKPALVQVGSDGLCWPLAHERDDDPGEYLTMSPRAEQCVWCHDVVPAGGSLELIVSYGTKKWWACQACAAEAWVGATETTNEEKQA